MASTELSRKELTALGKRAWRLWQDVTLHLHLNAVCYWGAPPTGGGDTMRRDYDETGEILVVHTAHSKTEWIM